MTDFLRRAEHQYDDPLSLIWLDCAARVGFRVQRSADAYASSDGRGTLLIATGDQFDPDDCLGQMILHELCHALVEGEDGERALDWGLDNTRMGHPWREHACLRLQAWLADSVGLRDFFAPTTDFRLSFWATLPADPLQATPASGGRRERSCVAARIAAWRSAQPRWQTALTEALNASAAIAATVRHLRPLAPDSGPKPDPETAVQPSLWATAVEPPPVHPAGHATVVAYFQGYSCQDCAWSYRGRGRLRCRHRPAVALAEDAPACSRYEPATELDCQTCGACCREAYDSVEVSARDPINRSHPEWILVMDTHRKLQRAGSRCIALNGGHNPTEAYACSIYADRPRSCRDFTRGSAHCLDARRRVGLSL
jgi:hypothetical protein